MQLTPLINPLSLLTPSPISQARESFVWPLELCPVYAAFDGLNAVKVPGQRAYVRTDTREVLGMAPETADPLTPSEFWEVVERAATRLNGTVVAAGDLDRGLKQVVVVGWRESYLAGDSAQCRLVFTNNLKTGLEIMPLIETTDAAVVYAPMNKLYKRSSTQVRQEAAAGSLRQFVETVAVECGQRLVTAQQWDKWLLPDDEKALGAFVMFLQQAAFQATSAEVMSNTGAGKNFLDRKDSLFEYAASRAELLDHSPFSWLNMFLSLTAVLDAEVAAKRKLNDLQVFEGRLGSTLYEIKARAFKAFGHYGAQLCQ